jgi:hypothetical protein
LAATGNVLLSAFIQTQQTTIFLPYLELRLRPEEVEERPSRLAALLALREPSPPIEPLLAGQLARNTLLALSERSELLTEPEQMAR